MIDTHCHLTDAAFAADVDAVLHRATEAGVNAIVCVSECAIDAHTVLALHARYPKLVRPSVGLHPERAALLSATVMRDEVEQLAHLARVHASSSSPSTLVAIGEVGLDFTPHVLSSSSPSQLATSVSPVSSSASPSPSLRSPEEVKEIQREAFMRQIDVACELDLPLSVHSRGAGRHALAMLEPRREARACMHAFDGRAVYAERMLEAHANTYFSVPPSVVRVEQFAKLVKRVPLHRLLLESDAPALPAIAGTRNEPAEIAKALNMIAALKGVSVVHARGVINDNTQAVFTRL